MQLILRKKKVLALVLGLALLSLLVVRDFHSYLLQSMSHGASSGGSHYDKSVLEVRRYDSELGDFRVLFSKLRDAKEANDLMTDLKDAIPVDDVEEMGEYEVEESDSPGGGGGGVIEVDEELVKKTETVVATMKFKSLTQAPHYDINIDDNDEDEEEVAEHYVEQEGVVKPLIQAPHYDINIDDNDEEEEAQHYVEQEGVEPEDGKNSELEFHSLPSKVFSRPKPRLRIGTIDSVQPLDQSVSRFQRQKTTVDVIKKLLLHNETESAEALWAVAQNQRPEIKKPSQTISSVQTTRAHNKDSNKESNRFLVQSSMSWPLPQFTRTDILQSQWVEELKNYLGGITEFKQISIVTANLEHQEVVLNWLISAVTVAKLSPRNILVLSLSVRLHELLVSKKINSIHVHPTRVMNTVGLKHITSAFNQIHIVRLTFFRLINHWGYDIVMYDSDAVVLKNPQPLFEANAGVELVGSAGKGPESIGHVWGRTICTGVLLMRSSPDLEIWWEKMSRVSRLPFTDQGLVNIALKSLHVDWDRNSPLHVDTDMHGSCKHTRLRAVILSEEKICRYHCDGGKRGQYYVWHKPAIKRNRTVENKKARARDGGAWLLREDWAQLSKMTSLTGVTWLLSIS